jgi:hypothetical protein
MNAAQPATVTAYTQTEIDRVKADGTVAVVHYETTLPGVLSLDPEDVADFLTAPVYPEEAFLDSGAEPAIVEDTVTGRIYAVT